MKNRYYPCAILLWAMNAPLCQAAVAEHDTKKLIPGSSEIKLFKTDVEERQEELNAKDQERANLLASDREFNTSINGSIEQIKSAINAYEHELRMRPENEYIKQRLEASRERLQYLNDLKYFRAQKLALTQEIIKLDKEYLSDPDKKKFAQNFLGKDRSSFSFDDDLLMIHEMILEREKDITVLTEQETNTNAELENRKRAAQANVENYQTKKDKSEYVGLNAKQRADIEAFKELVYNDRKAVDAMRLTEAMDKLTVVRLKLMNAKQQLDVLKGVLRTIKPLTRISEADVAIALDELDKKKQQSFAVKEEYRQQLEKLTFDIKNKERDVETLSKRFNIPINVELDEWAKEAKRASNSFIALAAVGTLNDELLLLKRKKELVEAYLALEEEKLRNEALRISVKDSFFKLIYQRFATEELVSKEIKKYETPKAENKANIALFKEKQNALTSLITVQKKALENIKSKQRNAQAEQTVVFRDAPDDYDQYTMLLKQAERLIQEQLDYLGKIAGVYTDILAKVVNASKHIDFINSELGSTTIWYRPESAISWEGLKNSISDIQVFSKDVIEYIATMSLSSVWDFIKCLFQSPGQLFLLFLRLLVLFLFFFFLKKFLPIITQKLVSIQRAPMGVRWLGILSAMLLGFSVKHVIALLLWVLAFIGFAFYTPHDPYYYILFYLFSIPYLLYLANRWIAYFVYFNQQHDYCLLSKDYQERFILVFSTVTYATIIIVFFREAFILGNYHKSELPTILLAINFIIFQIGAILLLSKDQILSLISTKNDFGAWLYDQVDTYYYFLQFIVIAIIVMSNPYVGYGRLVLFIVKRLIYTAILLQLLVWLHDWFKRVTSRFFFYFDSDEEIARDRFYYAKTLYGFLVILIFAAFTFIGLLIAARIWHWPEVLMKVQNWSDVMVWIKTPFLLANTKSAISVYSIFKIFGFIAIGSLVTVIINRLVLGRIFDILLVDAGVQNTISSLIRYVIIITSIILGFTAVGLEELVWYMLWGLVLGIGWVIKDPAADLIAYFILIVQRPLKVGDYVYMDENTNGVVRRITPRSVELRRKNSTTLIIPNVQVTTKTVVNWNHARGFIAFEDILVTIPYKADPQQVRELLMRVLDESRVILKNPRPVVRLESFSDLGYVFLVRGYLSSNHTLDMWDIASDVRFAIVKRLHENGIEIAYPVRILVSNSGDRKIDELRERELSNKNR